VVVLMTYKGMSYDFLAKFDTNGNLKWSKSFGTSGNDSGLNVTVDKNGNIYVTGYIENEFNGHKHAGGRDAFIFKYHTDGNLISSLLFGTIGVEVA